MHTRLHTTIVSSAFSNLSTLRAFSTTFRFQCCKTPFQSGRKAKPDKQKFAFSNLSRLVWTGPEKVYFNKLTVYYLIAQRCETFLSGALVHFHCFLQNFFINKFQKGYVSNVQRTMLTLNRNQQRIHFYLNQNRNKTGLFTIPPKIQLCLCVQY